MCSLKAEVYLCGRGPYTARAECSSVSARTVRIELCMCETERVAGYYNNVVVRMRSICARPHQCARLQSHIRISILGPLQFPQNLLNAVPSHSVLKTPNKGTQGQFTHSLVRGLPCSPLADI